MRRSAPPFALAALAVLLLAGCSADAPSTRTTSPDPVSPGAEVDPYPTACVVGSWTADVDDLAAQLGDALAGTGMDVVTTRAAGTQTVTFDEDGPFRFDNDVAFAADIRIGDGPAMTASQRHRGTMTATWGWDSSSGRPAMLFADLDDSEYEIENTVSIAGVVSSTPIEVPDVVGTSGRLFVSCEGDELVTSWEDGLFMTTWRRA